MCVEEKAETLKTRLHRLLEQEALKRGKFTLSSGKESSYYLDGRVITLTPEGAYLTASLILKMAEGTKIEAIGGPTLGADPIVGAVAVLCHIRHIPMKTFIVRKAAKEHGTQRQLEGPRIGRGASVIVVDDVATTGKAIIEAKQALDREGIAIAKALVIVDRLEGAKENLAAAGITLQSIFTIKDFGL